MTRWRLCGGCCGTDCMTPRSVLAPWTQPLVDGVTEQVESDHEHDDGRPGEQHHPPGDAQKALRVVREVAEAHHVRVGEPHEPQARLDEARARAMSVIMTTAEGKAFGMTWRSNTRSSLAPSERAAPVLPGDILAQLEAVDAAVLLDPPLPGQLGEGLASSDLPCGVSSLPCTAMPATKPPSDARGRAVSAAFQRGVVRGQRSAGRRNGEEVSGGDRAGQSQGGVSVDEPRPGRPVEPFPGGLTHMAGPVRDVTCGRLED